MLVVGRHFKTIYSKQQNQPKQVFFQAAHPPQNNFKHVELHKLFGGCSTITLKTDPLPHNIFPIYFGGPPLNYLKLFQSASTPVGEKYFAS